MADNSLTDLSEPAVADELRALVQQARGGDPTGLARIREILENHPEILEYANSLSAIVERVWNGVIGADDPGTVEPLKQAVAKMRAELVGYQPTRLEQMLVAQVVANWMEITYLQRITADPGHSTFQRICSDRLVSANQGYDAARKQLMTLRQLIPRESTRLNGMRLFEPEPNVERVDMPWRPCFDDI